MTPRSLVITGASTGIGRAVVARGVREGARVFASVRSNADAASLTTEFGDAVSPLIFDVTDEAAVRAAAGDVAAMLGDERLFGLVNNAGVATPGPLLHLSTEELARQLDINVLGQHRVTRAFAPLLGVDGARTGPPGRILMISSVAGENAMPFVGAYAASKHALEGYSKALRRELMLYGIDVIVIGPGAIATPIWEKADAGDYSAFAKTDYAPFLEKARDYMVGNGRSGLPAAEVGDLIWRALTIARPKTRYAILRRPFFDRTLPRWMGPRRVDRIVAKRLGLAPRT